jgi:hypothetical protein
MKNIHVLPTDKPSRLCIDNSCDELNYSEIEALSSKHITNQHIYITSDLDINENDYIITSDGKLVQVSYLLSKDVDGGLKVIMATDQDLIKDGVQAIDDKFLEWFVKNPSCEFVEVENEMVASKLSSIERWDYEYKIIIPDLWGEVFNWLAQEEPKQETLEEAKQRILDSNYLSLNDADIFKMGAEWQRKQILDFLYSEITERRDYSASKMCEKVVEFIEQF